MENLTSRQSEVLASIRDYIERHGFPPTIAELTSVLGIRSPNAVRDHLRTLARKEVIELTPATSRGIRLLTPQNDAATHLPIVGRVAAGSPILAEQHIEAHHQIDATLFKPRADYLLRVHGTSMQNAGILDGDLLAVHQTKQAENRQIVVARIDNEVTVKRFKRTDHLVHLLPENNDFDPIEVDLRHEQLTIEGLGVGVVRREMN